MFENILYLSFQYSSGSKCIIYAKTCYFQAVMAAHGGFKLVTCTTLLYSVFYLM